MTSHEYHDNSEMDDIFNMLQQSKSNTFDKKETSICFHQTSEKINGINICKECGLEVSIDIGNEFRSFEKKNVRCQHKKENEKTIYVHLDKIKDLPFYIKEEVNREYYEKFNNEIHRGNKLKGVIFAIVFNKCKQHKKPMIPEKLWEDLEIDRKVASCGNKTYTQVMGKTKKNTFISIEDYIEPIMKKFNGNDYDIKNITDICKRIKNTSSIINSSTPISICAAIIFYYSNLVKKGITAANYAKIVNLSEITILKLCSHIAEILKATPTGE